MTQKTFVVETLIFSHDAKNSLDILTDSGIDGAIQPNHTLFDIVVFSEEDLKKAKKLV